LTAHPDPAAWGVLTRYRSAGGNWREVSARVVASVLEGMGAQTRQPPATAPARFIAAGSQLRSQLRLEDGSLLPPGKPVPAGYHRLRDRLVVASPRGCPLPEVRQWGFAAQLYSVRSRRSWGIGDFADLRRLALWSHRLGARLLLLNPLHAPAPGLPQQPSPYYASSRRFRNPLYINVEEAPGAAAAGVAVERAAAAARALNARRRIDRDAAYRLKVEALEEIWAGFSSDRGFDEFRRREGEALQDFATWCALAEQHGRAWRDWPSPLRHPGAAAVARFRSEHEGRVRFHQWLQWLLEKQLGRAGREISLIADLAVGFDPDGADAWLYQDVLAERFRVGAPPDLFLPDGQDWGLPPFDPWKLRAAGYGPFIETVRAALTHAGGLRIDHVMGLFRLWWIELGREPGDGAYIRYPARELLDIVALESRRAGAYVVGEDLGTVEPAVRRELGRRNILGSRVFWFETRAPERYPEHALASLTTHDLPTLAGVWTGADSAYLRQLGREPFEANERRQRRRLARTAKVGLRAGVEEAFVGAYAALGRSRCRLLAVSLEDVLAVTERPNFPGTKVDEWPDWSLALPATLEELQRDSRATRVAAVLRPARSL
jgi:4-alpha-glucanotransferase